MKILLYSTTGMVGHGVLRACLEADDVGRTTPGMFRAKLDDAVRLELFNHIDVKDKLAPTCNSHNRVS